jgi:hypothetical protein
VLFVLCGAKVSLRPPGRIPTPRGGTFAFVPMTVEGLHALLALGLER